MRVIKCRRLIWAGHVVRMKKIGAFKILTGKSTGRRPQGRPSLTRENNACMDPKEIAVNARIWVDWPRDEGNWRDLENEVLNLQVS